MKKPILFLLFTTYLLLMNETVYYFVGEYENYLSGPLVESSKSEQVKDTNGVIKHITKSTNGSNDTMMTTIRENNIVHILTYNTQEQQYEYSTQSFFISKYI